MNKTQLKPIIVVIAIGAALGGLILTWDKNTSPTIVDTQIETATKAATARDPEAENYLQQMVSV
jgi:hypothetical protein